MALFGKKEKKEGTACCGCACGAKSAAAETTGARVKVLGSGCAKCNQLETAARTALQQLGMNPEIDHVTDFSKIAAYGVMSTPALVVDEKVVSCGKVLKTEEVVDILRKLEEQA
ncbi:MAG: thioredoxin family protein [Oscillospiraceae bacterium]|jgi:small redox-active disulfide protein 2|nr:thioredoxin family protein [Oscillospiraceae bacterium]